jgi:hypothetical protein
MSWWNAKYTNGDGDNEITFGSKYYERAKAVEKVCQDVIDKKVKTPDDVAVVVRCKDCKHEFGGSCVICGFQSRKPEDFCSYGKRKEE